MHFLEVKTWKYRGQEVQYFMTRESMKRLGKIFCGQAGKGSRRCFEVCYSVLYPYATNRPIQSVRIVEPGLHFTSGADNNHNNSSWFIDLFYNVPFHVISHWIQHHKSYVEGYYYSHSAGLGAKTQSS